MKIKRFTVISLFITKRSAILVGSKLNNFYAKSVSSFSLLIVSSYALYSDKLLLQSTKHYIKVF